MPRVQKGRIGALLQTIDSAGAIRLQFVFRNEVVVERIMRPPDTTTIGISSRNAATGYRLDCCESKLRRRQMHWYNYVACFFAGSFLANVVPHFVHGISGDRFPTPFAKPPGRGLSSPTVNVLWALLNLVVGYLLLRVANVGSDSSTLVIFLAGIAAIGLILSFRFRSKLED